MEKNLKKKSAQSQNKLQIRKSQSNVNLCKARQKDYEKLPLLMRLQEIGQIHMKPYKAPHHRRFSECSSMHSGEENLVRIRNTEKKFQKRNFPLESFSINNQKKYEKMGTQGNQSSTLQVKRLRQKQERSSIVREYHFCKKREWIMESLIDGHITIQKPVERAQFAYKLIIFLFSMTPLILKRKKLMEEKRKTEMRSKILAEQREKYRNKRKIKL